MIWRNKMKLGTVERIFTLIAAALMIAFFLIACTSIAQISEELKEQNKTLNDISIALQVQNEILKFNPMEDDR